MKNYIVLNESEYTMWATIRDYLEDECFDIPEEVEEAVRKFEDKIAVDELEEN